jgi:hypothetical protein
MAALRDATQHDDEIQLSAANWQRVAARFSTYSIAQKTRRFLEYIGDSSYGRAGARIVINDQLDYPRFAAADIDEYHWLRRLLLRRQLVEKDGDGLTLTMEG